MENIKDLNYYKNNCEEDYITTPISVLRYITELEQALQLHKTNVMRSFYCDSKDCNDSKGALCNGFCKGLAEEPKNDA